MKKEEICGARKGPWICDAPKHNTPKNADRHYMVKAAPTKEKK